MSATASFDYREEVVIFDGANYHQAFFLKDFPTLGSCLVQIGREIKLVASHEVRANEVKVENPA